jgi:hypothetical protein
MPCELGAITITYILLDPRIIDMLLKPNRKIRYEYMNHPLTEKGHTVRMVNPTFWSVRRGINEVILTVLYDQHGFVRSLTYDEGSNLGPVACFYSNRKEDGDVLIMLFGRANLMLSHNPNHLLTHLLEQLLYEFDRKMKSDRPF